MTSIMISCGATLADIIDRHFRNRPVIEKLRPGDDRGEYGEYVLYADTSTAEMILRRYRRVARCA